MRIRANAEIKKLVKETKLGLSTGRQTSLSLYRRSLEIEFGDDWTKRRFDGTLIDEALEMEDVLVKMLVAEGTDANTARRYMSACRETIIHGRANFVLSHTGKQRSKDILAKMATMPDSLPEGERYERAKALVQQERREAVVRQQQMEGQDNALVLHRKSDQEDRNQYLRGFVEAANAFLVEQGFAEELRYGPEESRQPSDNAEEDPYHRVSPASAPVLEEPPPNREVGAVPLWRLPYPEEGVEYAELLYAAIAAHVCRHDVAMLVSHLPSHVAAIFKLFRAAESVAP